MGKRIAVFGVGALGGYVGGSQAGTADDAATLTLRIPAQRFDDALQRLVQQVPEPKVIKGDDRASRELRTYGIGAQIIADLGVRTVRLPLIP